jgi:hypothetical protein
VQKLVFDGFAISPDVLPALLATLPKNLLINRFSHYGVLKKSNSYLPGKNELPV